MKKVPNKNIQRLKLIKNLGTEKIGNSWRSHGIYECPHCLIHFKTRTDSMNAGNIKQCKSCASSRRHSKCPDKKRLGRVFTSMKQRCGNKNTASYQWYGAKGVKVEFESVDIFYEWAMNNGYRQGLTIDRINSNGNYTPSNCRWITNSENAILSNIRKTHGSNKHIRISEDEASEICEAYDTGLFVYTDFANQYNCCSSTIGVIVRGSKL